MRFPELNKRDAKALQRGYYEGLQGVTDQNPELRELMADRPTDGQDIWQSGVLVERPDFLGREMQPMWGTYQGGQSFRTNEFGMRDGAYARVKPSKTFRIRPARAVVRGRGRRERRRDLSRAARRGQP
ncbi:MAG: hypothetical protein IPJ78_07310 [Gemmatimonadetes bacterium]|nr:hypothetical protein [Gemmatimonadota bacterium]